MRKIMNVPIAGMRVIKTALAVFLCLVIADYMHAQQSTYAAIVAIVCMQKDWGNSINESIKRIVATLFGVAFGFFTFKSIVWLGLYDSMYLRHAYTALMMIILVNVLLILEKHNVTSVACIVFISVSTIHDSNIVAGQFALTRMLDTFVGIGVSLIVNMTLTDSLIKWFENLYDQFTQGGLYK